MLKKFIFITIFLTSILNCNNYKVYDHAIRLPINSSIGNIRIIKFMPDNNSVIIHATSKDGDNFYRYNYIRNKLNKVFQPNLNNYLYREVDCGYYFILNNDEIIVFDWMSEKRRVVYVLNMHSNKINKLYLPSDNTYRVQSTQNRFVFIEPYIESNYEDISGFSIYHYPHQENKYTFPLYFNKLGFEFEQYCFGKNSDEIIFTCTDRKLKKRNIIVYNYLNKHIMRTYPLPFNLIEEESFSDILLSPDGRYLAIDHIVLGLYIIDFDNNILYDIDLFNKYSYFPHEVYIMDWSWDSKYLLVNLSDGDYLIPINKINDISKNKFYLHPKSTF